MIYAAIDKDKDNAVNIYSGMVDYGSACSVSPWITLPRLSPEDGKWDDSPKWTIRRERYRSGTNVLINYVPNEYTIYYHGSGGVTESGAEQSTSTFKYGSEATIKNNPFTYEGYAFEGWALSADGEVVYTVAKKFRSPKNTSADCSKTARLNSTLSGPRTSSAAAITATSPTALPTTGKCS